VTRAEGTVRHFHDEFAMTKGHFHTVLETAEVYYCLRDQGMMVMETPEGIGPSRSFGPGWCCTYQRAGRTGR
jgi:oxalate decarboxylase/phosphoglucose isomerase-like protein (cupin superfamily)